MAEQSPDLERDPEAQRALAAVLDELIPPSEDGRLPGAGGLGLAALLVAGLGEKPELRPLLAGGLAALDAAARERGATGFAALGREQRLAALHGLGSAAPAFVPTLVFLTYVAYYQHPTVLETLGHEPRPPFPKGYEVPPTDFAILDPVRRRAPIYRQP